MGVSVLVTVRCDGTNPGPWVSHPGFRCTNEVQSSGATPTAVQARLLSEGWVYSGTGLDAKTFCPQH